MLLSFTAPVNIRFPSQSIADVSFVVQWDAIINQSVDRYIVSVYWIDNRKPIQSVTIHFTSYTVTGLTPNTTYTVTVTAVNESGCTGVVSVGKEVTTIVSIPMDITSTVNSLSSTNSTTSVNEKVTTSFMDTTHTTIGTSGSPSINPTVTTVITDNAVTDVIKATINSVTKLVPTVSVIITSTAILMSAMNATTYVATTYVATAGTLMSVC